MIRIACIAATTQMAATMEEVSKPYKTVTIIKVDDLHRVAEMVENLRDQGVEIVVTRGLLAETIKQVDRSLEIAEIPLTVLDVSRVLEASRIYSGVIGLCEKKTNEWIIREAEAHTGISVVFKNLIQYQEAERSLQQLHEAGVTVMIGKTVECQIASRIGMTPVPLEPGKEAISLALKMAVRIMRVKYAEAAKAEQFKTILDYAHEGIVAVDANGNITFFNPVAGRILGLQKEQVIGQPAARVIQNTGFPRVLQSGEPWMEGFQEVNNTTIITNRIPIFVNGKLEGAVATFQEVSQLQYLEQKARQQLSTRGHFARYSFSNVLGNSEAIQTCLAQAKKYAVVNSTILMIGETGTGKEIFAHAIHNASKRHDKPFVAVNCAVLPESLLESELFGYEEGAFTGASKGGKQGLFEIAHQGTIFLDEIPEMTPRVQSELLRVLEQHEVTRIGGNRVIPVNVRVIAATNQNLRKLVEKGLFREDLFHRLNVLRLDIPPLRSRKEDIPQLASSFLAEISRKHHGFSASFHPEAFKVFQRHDWSGNIRELKNTVERACVLYADRLIAAEQVKQAMVEIGDNEIEEKELQWAEIIKPLREKPPHQVDLKQAEEQAILQALEQAGGSKTKAAEALGIGRTTLWRKLQKMSRT
ncbi:sigma 54-interacting transcriptional regulator [Anoxynatronum buryatiense]|uniref:PAS domain S-box-containing protein n=1 Tax=Anoxynatronum buryatiense TaxID=489973 RepID=A0AA46AIW0_9CLOT|nr:sigma 54-interacting transcriptional regulator [Anoxynatronum buryatiense]SMP53797.1 PAS domain S-box-containing protein [Anoxynatronum buryatiense]